MIPGTHVSIKVILLMVASLLGMGACCSVSETGDVVREAKSVAAEYWQARVAFWKSASEFMAEHPVLLSDARRVAELEQNIYALTDDRIRSLVMAEMGFAALVNLVVEEASLSVSCFPEHSGVVANRRAIDRLREELLVLRSKLSDADVARINEATRAAIAKKLEELESEERLLTEQLHTEHPRMKAAVPARASLQDAEKVLSLDLRTDSQSEP